MKYLALSFVLALGLIELALRATILVCIIIVTLIVPFCFYVDDHPADFKDLMTPVAFKLAERIVA